MALVLVKQKPGMETFGMDLMTRSTKRAVTGLALAALLLTGLAAPVRAAQLEIVFKDGLWGAGIGALIGVAQVASFKNPDNEYYRIPNDAAIGAILGVVFGFVEISGAMASYDHEKNQLAIGVPAIQYSNDEHGTKVMADLFDAKF
jgi:hypothetical protein